MGHAEARAYEEIVEFIAGGSSPRSVVAFRPSEKTRARVAELLSREKSGALTPEEASELEHYSQLEHIMRLAKARAQRFLTES
jgi:hypothetical protein